MVVAVLCFVQIFNGAIYEAIVEENQLEKIFWFPAKEPNLQWEGLGQSIYVC